MNSAIVSAKIGSLLPGKAGDSGRTGSDWLMPWEGRCVSSSRPVRSPTSRKRRRFWRTIGNAVLADKAYGSNNLREPIAAMGAEALIPSNRSRKIIIPHDELAYIDGNRIERCFNRMKHFRRFATRYDRRATHFQGFVYLAATIIWLQ